MYSIDTAQLVYLTIYELKMFATARVNGQDTLAYLDTAATDVTVSPQVANASPRTGKIKVRSAFGEKEFDTVSVNMEFMGKPLPNTKARVHEDDSATPFRSDVTLGGRELFNQALIYDFRVLALLSGAGVDVKAWKEIPAEFLDVGLCIVDMNVGRTTVKALFDTGAGITVVNSAHVKENALMLAPSFDLEISDATGARSKQVISVCHGLRIGGIETLLFDSIVVDLRDIEDMIGRRIDLVFGANAMLKSSLRWLFDKGRGKVFVMQ